MKCHKLPWKQRGTVLRNAISRRRQSPSKLQASKPPPMVLLQYFMPYVTPPAVPPNTRNVSTSWIISFFKMPKHQEAMVSTMVIKKFRMAFSAFVWPGSCANCNVQFFFHGPFVLIEQLSCSLVVPFKHFLFAIMILFDGSGIRWTWLFRLFVLYTCSWLSPFICMQWYLR